MRTGVTEKLRTRKGLREKKCTLREKKRDTEEEEEMFNIKPGFGERNNNPSFCHLNYARIAGFYFTTPNLSPTK